MNFQSPQENQNEICSHCKTSLPLLFTNQPAKYRFCSSCGAPIQLQANWQPKLTVDEQGNIVTDPAKISVVSPLLSVQSCLSYVEANPGRLVSVGAATVVLGGGLLVVAAPLAALASAIVAGGVAILSISVVAGVLTAVCASFSKNGDIGTMLKAVGIVALGGIATIVAGGVIGFLASLCGLLGSIFMACGGIGIAAIIARQIQLRNQANLEQSEIQKNIAKATEVSILNVEDLREFFPN